MRAGVEPAHDGEEAPGRTPPTPRAPSDDGLELRILGPVELRDARGADVPIGGTKPRALLASLALHDHETVSTDRLTYLLWGGEVPGAPRASIQSYVSRLRAVLGREAVEHAGEGYRLTRDGLAVDLRRADELVTAGRGALEDGRASDAVRLLGAALRQWRGRPLAGLGDIPLVTESRPGLEEMRLSIVEQRFGAELEAGHTTGLIPELEALVGAHPFRERLRGHLMLALYRSGRQADALAEFRRARTLLVSELGVEPGTELTTIHDRILAQDPRLSGPTRSREPTGPTASPAAGSTGLIGRQREVTVLRRLLGQAASGRARVALIGGEAGIGKTRLLQEVVAHAEQERARVLIGRCSDAGGSASPYAPFSQLLRGVADDEGLEHLQQLRAGPLGGALAHLVPELSREDAADAEAEEARRRIFTVMLHAVTALCRDRPLLVGLEDLHRGDRSTLDLLTFLVRNLARERVLLVATFRSDEAGDSDRLTELLAELPRSSDVLRLELGSFTEAEVGLQARRILGRGVDAGTVRRLTSRSGGSPFYVEELLATGESPSALPATIRDVVRGRLTDLTDAASIVLAHAAVVGRPADHRLLERATSLDREELDRALGDVTTRHLLVVEDGRYRFRHALVQEVVYEDLPPGRRADVHRSVAEALSADGPGRAAGEVAHHWHAAGEDREAFQASLVAAGCSRRIGAFAESLHHYERALALWDTVAPARDRSGVLADAAEVAGHAGRAEVRVAYLRECLRRMPSDADAARRADIGSRLARALFDLGDDHAALRQAEVASRRVDHREPSAVQVRAMSNYASMLLTSVRTDRQRAIPPARAAVEAARRIGDPAAEAHARERLGSALAWTGALDRGIAELRRARDTARRAGDPSATMAAYFGLFFVLHDLARRYEDAREVRDEALSWLDVHDDRWAASAGLLTRLSYSHLRAGRWRDAEALLDRVGRHHLEGGQELSFRTARATLRWMQGRPGDAASDVVRVRDGGPGTRLHQDIFPLAAELAAEDGDVARARAIAREHDQLEVEPAEAPMRGATMRALVRAEVDACLRASPTERSGHATRARSAVDALRRLVASAPAFDGTFQLERPRTYLELAEAELTRITGPDPDAWRQLAGAAAYVYWRVYAGFRHVEALVASGRGRQATALRREVQDQADRIGAEGLSRRLVSLAARSG